MKAECIGKHAPDGIKVLPFDLIGPPEELQQAAADAVQAFPSLDYLIHNAGTGNDSFGTKISFCTHQQQGLTLRIVFDCCQIAFCVPQIHMLNVQSTIHARYATVM